MVVLNQHADLIIDHLECQPHKHNDHDFVLAGA